LTPAHSLPIGTPICLAMYPPVKFPIAPVGITMSIMQSLLANRNEELLKWEQFNIVDFIMLWIYILLSPGLTPKRSAILK
jgi:hypothetical protein